MKLQYTGTYPSPIKLGDYDGQEVMLDPSKQPLEVLDSIGAQIQRDYPGVFVVVESAARTTKTVSGGE